MLNGTRHLHGVISTRKRRTLCRRSCGSMSPRTLPQDPDRTEAGTIYRAPTALPDAIREPDALIKARANTIAGEEEPGIRDGLCRLFATNHAPESGAATLGELLDCLPKVAPVAELRYNDIFRVLIVHFIDA